MKKILISILISCSILTTAYAQTLIPSLSTQMQQQERINIKNAHTSRLAEIANKKAAAKARLLALKNRSNKSVAPVVTIALAKTTTLTPSNIVINSSPVDSSPNISTLIWVDMTRVRSTWLGWYNDTRGSLGLGSYSYDSRLDSTAHDWNIRFADGKWLNHHRRNPWDSYYDFPVIDAWFTARGVSPKVINRSKNTENVGYGYYDCNSSDCTDALIRSIRTTYDFFYSEKWKAYDAHYRSIVNPYFTRVGMDIIVVPSERRYYLTMHFITE